MYNPLKVAVLKKHFYWRRNNKEHSNFNSGRHFTQKFETSIVPTFSGRHVTIRQFCLSLGLKMAGKKCSF
jgi:hypothetical protein